MSCRHTSNNTPHAAFLSASCGRHSLSDLPWCCCRQCHKHYWTCLYQSWRQYACCQWSSAWWNGSSWQWWSERDKWCNPPSHGRRFPAERHWYIRPPDHRGSWRFARLRHCSSIVCHTLKMSTTNHSNIKLGLIISFQFEPKSIPLKYMWYFPIKFLHFFSLNKYFIFSFLKSKYV